MAFVTIKRFEFLHQAELMKNTLENEGIPCALFDDQMIGLNPLYSNAIGGIKMKVNQVDRERAMKVLELLDQNQDDLIGITCPKCGSNKVEPSKNFKGLKGILSLITAFTYMIFPLYQKQSFFCKDCGGVFIAQENLKK